VTRRDGISKVLRAFALITGGLFLASSLSAHHSTAANFDRTSTVSVNGVVTSWKFQNPHAQFTVDVTDEGGEIETWLIVMSAKNQLVRTGAWNAETFKPGQVVTVFGYEGYRPAQMFFTRVIMPDGTELQPGPILTAQPAPQPVRN